MNYWYGNGEIILQIGKEKKKTAICYINGTKRSRVEHVKRFILSNYCSTLIVALNNHDIIISYSIFKVLELAVTSKFVILTIEKVTSSNGGAKLSTKNTYMHFTAKTKSDLASTIYKHSSFLPILNYPNQS